MRAFVVFASLLVVALAAPKKQSAIPLIDGRIVGGENADIKDYPYQISLMYATSYICGGSIIGSKWVVTAAHCTYETSARSLSIRAGSSFRIFGGQVIKVAALHQHPKYNSSTIDWDISILELAEEITVENASPIALPVANSPIATGANSTITGWGTTSENGYLSLRLQVVIVPSVSIEACRAAYGASKITDRMMCAGLTEGGKDACQGDSGGPLVIDGKLIGIVSWGYGCARPKTPGVYSSVPALRDFITEITGI